MNPSSPDPLEAELKRMRLAKPPKEVLDALAEKLPRGSVARGRTQPASWNWTGLWRWLVPVGAAAIVSLVFYLKYPQLSKPANARTSGSRAPVLKADKVEIDRQLVADFDAIAKLPSGQPVRFRCEQWMDKVQWRDSAKGLVVEQTTPRLEIVPIRFETY